MDCVQKQTMSVIGYVTRLLLLTLAFQAIASGQTAVVRLRTTATPPNSLVLLGDIADITSSDPAFAQRLAKIDLVETGTTQLSTIIPRKQIAIRLRIEGIPPSSFQLVGATDVSVTPTGLATNFVQPAAGIEPAPAPSLTLEQRILDAMNQQLTLRLQQPAKTITPRLIQPLPKLPGRSNKTIDQVEVVLGQPSIGGTYRPRVYLRHMGELLATWNIPIEVTQTRTVVEATRVIPAGAALTPDNTREIRRDVLDASQLIAANDVSGMVASQLIQPGDPIRFRQLRAAPQTQNVAIRRSERVQLIARRGNLRVTINNGEAMHDAAIGETLRVRNPSSRSVIVGRVVNGNQVEVLY